MRHHSPNSILTPGLCLLCTAVVLCALLALSLPAASTALADEPQKWPTPGIWAPPTHAPTAKATSAPTNTPVPPTSIPTSTSTNIPTDTPSDTPTSTSEPPTSTLPPSTPTPFPTFTPVPTDTLLPTDTPSPTETASSTPSWLPPDAVCYVKPGKAVFTLPVPYIHQVNDISSADGNWACGPTSVAMALAYYSKLQPWPGSEPPASADSGSQFAPYVTNVYTNNGHTYSAVAADPQGRMVAGLYGTISPTGLADWGRIRQALQWHGLSSQNVSVSFEGIKAALDRGHPVLIGNGLTAAGHVLVAVGYTNNNQLIVNDPYGDRFEAGYGSNNGQGVYYAWSCMRAHNALEVIGTYIPPATATPTPKPTGTPTTAPTSTDTTVASATATVTPTQAALLTVTKPKDPANNSGASPLYKAYSLLAGSTYDSTNSLRAATGAGVGSDKALAVLLLMLSVLAIVAGAYWLVTTRRKPDDGRRTTDDRRQTTDDRRRTTVRIETPRSPRSPRN